MSGVFIDNLLRSLSWTFIHSLWQGLILTIIAGIVMCCTRKISASVRYGILSILFFLFVGVAGITFMIEWNKGTSSSPGLRVLENIAQTNLLFNRSVFGPNYIKIVTFLNAKAQWIVYIWLVVLGFKSARIILDLVYVHRLRNQNVFPPSEEWQSKFRMLIGKLGIKTKIAFVESARIKIPAVIGYFKPVVLIPAGIITQLPAREVESILLHELAHIRRHDYLVNFIQRMAELIFFFNPGLLWVSALLRSERENCCDDLVISATGNKAEYLNAIISFKEHSMKQSGYVLGLFGKQNRLLQRMMRLVYEKNRNLSPFELVFFISNIVIFVLFLAAMQKPEKPGLTNLIPGNLSAETLPSFAVNQAENAQKVFSQEIKTEPLESSEKPDGRTTGERLTQTITISENQSIRNEIILLKQEQSNKNQLFSELTEEQVVADHSFQDEYLKKTKREEYVGAGSKDVELVTEMTLEAERNFIQSKLQSLQFEMDRDQAKRNRQQAQQDRLQAVKDRQQAEMDRIVADRDREQAEIERRHAVKDKENAQFDRLRNNRLKAHVD